MPIIRFNARHQGKTLTVSRLIEKVLKATKGDPPVCLILPSSQIENVCAALNASLGAEYSVAVEVVPRPAAQSALLFTKESAINPPRKKPTTVTGIWIEQESTKS